MNIDYQHGYFDGHGDGERRKELELAAVNIDGLTNKQLLTAALRALLEEAAIGNVTERGVYGVFHPIDTLEAARAALLEVDRPKGTDRNRPKRHGSPRNPTRRRRTTPAIPEMDT